MFFPDYFRPKTAFVLFTSAPLCVGGTLSLEQRGCGGIYQGISGRILTQKTSEMDTKPFNIRYFDS